MTTIDKFDRKILYELSRDSRLSVERLAEKVGLSATPVRRRIKLLEEVGILKRYTIEIDLEKCGFGQLMYVYVKLKSRDRDTISKFEARVRTLSEVSVCNLITGAFDYILEIHTKDMQGYNAFLRDVLAELPGVFGIETSVVINPVKSEPFLP